MAHVATDGTYIDDMNPEPTLEISGLTDEDADTAKLAAGAAGEIISSIVKSQAKKEQKAADKYNAETGTGEKSKEDKAKKDNAEIKDDKKAPSENFLTKPLGPLPVWGWAASAVVAGLGGYLLLRKRSDCGLSREERCSQVPRIYHGACENRF